MIPTRNLPYFPILFTVQSKMLVNKKKQLYKNENKKFNKM